MAKQTRPDLRALIEQLFPDNTSEEITPAGVRTFLHALVDSAQLPATTAALGGLIVGPGLKVEASGKVSLKIDSNTLGQQADGTLYVPTTSGNISPAATPTNVTAVLSNGGYTANLSWDAKPGATLYQVYRQVNGGPWTLIVGIPYNYFVDTSGVTGGGTFTLYRITAANSLGESAPSTVAQAQ